VIVENTANLDRQGFDNRTSAVGVHPGPDYESWKRAHGGQEPTVGMYEQPGFRGAVLTLTAGAYPDIGFLHNFNDAVSSVRINPTPPAAATIAPIPVVVELFQERAFGGRRATIVEDVRDLAAYLGGGFGDAVSSVRVRQGPSYSRGARTELYPEPGFTGNPLRLEPGEYPDLDAAPFRFEDVISSVRLRAG
jgi:Beta/Gamma crystallin